MTAPWLFLRALVARFRCRLTPEQRAEIELW